MLIVHVDEHLHASLKPAICAHSQVLSELRAAEERSNEQQGYTHWAFKPHPGPASGLIRPRDALRMYQNHTAVNLDRFQSKGTGCPRHGVQLWEQRQTDTGAWSCLTSSLQRIVPCTMSMKCAGRPPMLRQGYASRQPCLGRHHRLLASNATGGS